MKKPMFKKIVIVGLGLMGGSLGLAIKKNKLAEVVVGLARRSQTLKEAKSIGAIDSGSMDAAIAVQDADLVIFCGPVSTTPELFKKMLPHLPQKCLLTDVGSTKAELVKSINRIVKKANKQGWDLTFIGSHPMTGSEKTGVKASKESLYEQAACLLIAQQNNGKKSLLRLEKLWKAVGCKTVLKVSAAKHDQLTALVSHLPHAVAVGITSVACKQALKDQTLMKIIGSGFRDTTRIAAGSAEMWVDIFLSNQQQVIKAITRMEQELGTLKALVNNGKWKKLYHFLAVAQEFRIKVEKT